MKQTFKMFLEAKVSNYDVTEIEADKLLELLETHCSNALEYYKTSSDSITRGWKSIKKSGIYHPGSGERKSQNTTNFYTQMYDTNPANNGWPKRSRSFICTTEIDTAQNYITDLDTGIDGTLTYVFPFNGTKIGVVPEDDIWEVGVEIDDYSISVTRLNSMINNISIRLSKAVPTTFKEFETFLNHIDPVKLHDAIKLAITEYTRITKGSLDHMLSENPNLIKDFCQDWKKVYSYEDAGFRLYDSVSDVFNGANSSDTEVWFDGKCVIITKEDMTHVLQHLKARNV